MLLPGKLQAILKDEGSNVFTVEMLSQANTLEEFEEFHPNEFVVFFEPPSLDDRIVNQMRPSLDVQSRDGTGPMAEGTSASCTAASLFRIA